MSEAKARARQRALDYLARLLQMNPVHEGTEIIALRSAALGLTTTAAAQSSTAADGQPADRRKLLDELESLRAQFWTMPLAALTKQLHALDGQGFADLEAAVARLRVVAAHRAKLPALAQQADFDGELFSSLKEILTRSPRDTAVLREQVLAAFRTRSRRKRGRKMIALLQRELPAIYNVEADWFATLSRQRAHVPTLRLTGKDRNNATPVGTSTNVGSYWWVLVLGSVAVRACASGFDHRDGANRSRNAPGYNYRVPNTREHQIQFPPRRSPRPREGTDSNVNGSPHTTGRSRPPGSSNQNDARELRAREGPVYTIERPSPPFPQEGGSPVAQPKWASPRVPPPTPHDDDPR